MTMAEQQAPEGHPMATADAVLDTLGRSTAVARRLEGVYRSPYDALVTAATQLRAESGDARWAEALLSIAHCVDQQAGRHLRARVELVERPTADLEPPPAEGQGSP